MAKERLSINELEEKKKQLIDEIERLKSFIESSDTSTFEIMIDDIKKQMHNNIAEEDWKSMKVNKGKIEEIRNVAKIIKNQSNLLEEKQDELDDVDYIGNIYDDSPDNQAALDALKFISDYLQQENTPESSEENNEDQE